MIFNYTINDERKLIIFIKKLKFVQHFVRVRPGAKFNSFQIITFDLGHECCMKTALMSIFLHDGKPF